MATLVERITNLGFNVYTEDLLRFKALYEEWVINSGNREKAHKEWGFLSLDIELELTKLFLDELEKNNIILANVSSTTLPNDIDKEIIELVKAINQFDGLETVISCCGHGKTPIQIWLKISNHDDRWLYPLSRMLNRRYGACRFTLSVDCNDRRHPYGPIMYLLESWEIGDHAYEDGIVLAHRLNKLYTEPKYWQWAWETEK
jgi:hypothetical protein